MNRKQVLLLNKNQYWNEYTEMGDKIIVDRIPPIKTFENAPTIRVEKGVGFLELIKGQEWKALGYKKQDKLCFSNTGQEYEILNIDKQVAKISLTTTVADSKKNTTAKSKIVVPIPVHGREPLLRQTIRRLKRQTHPVHIIIMGETPSERQIAEEEEVEFLKHQNHPLGAKWQAGMDRARELEADAVLMLGSADWLSDNWCEVLIQRINSGSDLVGKREMFFLDVDHQNNKKMVFWNGYTPWTNYRTMEPIGAGRLISKTILNKVDWQIYNTKAKKSMDFHSLLTILMAGGDVEMIEDPCNSVMALSLSFGHLWGNLHSFKELSCYPTSKRVLNIDEALESYFPHIEQSLEQINNHDSNN